MTIARCLCLVLLVGCATPMSALREDNQRLGQTVTELRSDRREQDRKMRDLQHQLDELRGKLAPTAEGSPPALPVEVVAPAAAAVAAMPGAARVVGVADDGTEIVYEGDAAVGRAAPEVNMELSQQQQPSPPSPPSPPQHRPPVAMRAAAPMADTPTTTDRLEVTRRIPPISARTAPRTATRDRTPPGERDGDAGAEYRAAVDLVKTGKHDEAVAALRAFIARYPRHDYADNAQYWIGEAYYAQKDFTRALSEFRAVVEVYPRGNKVPDALLKVGYCYAALGQADKARAMMEQVVTRYPKSEPATLAAKRLEKP